jgi:hypothetical protein
VIDRRRIDRAFVLEELAVEKALPEPLLIAAAGPLLVEDADWWRWKEGGDIKRVDVTIGLHIDEPTGRPSISATHADARLAALPNFPNHARQASTWSRS